MLAPWSNPYLELTQAFNRGRRRALISSGQAVVLHRLAIMSKDGDWILREDEEATCHVLDVVDGRGARYRFGAPLDVRWLAGGWSAHFEYRAADLRLRADFVSRPPRITDDERDRMWRDADDRDSDVVGLEPLATMKMTIREKDYAVIGELRAPDGGSAGRAAILPQQPGPDSPCSRTHRRGESRYGRRHHEPSRTSRCARRTVSSRRAPRACCRSRHRLSTDGDGPAPGALAGDNDA